MNRLGMARAYGNRLAMKVLRVLDGESAESKRRIGKITHSYRVKLKVPHAERRSLGESADWTTGVVQVLHRNAPNCLFIILNPQEIPTRGVAPLNLYKVPGTWQPGFMAWSAGPQRHW